MKIIICGAGQVGWQISKHLSSENNDITIIDKDPDLIRNISNSLDVATITGIASHPNILERAGAKDADMIIAVTISDEINMVICQVAHSVFSIPRKIARIRDQSYLGMDYSDLYRTEHMPIDVIISPEKEVAKAAIQRLILPEAFETSFFLDEDALLLGLRLSDECDVLNTPLNQLTELFSTLEAVVVGIRRNQKLFTPKPEDQLFSNDEIYVFSSSKDRARTLEIFGKTKQKGDKIIIVGAGNVGFGVAKILEKNKDSNFHAKIIEKNIDIAEKVADGLEKTIVLNGDGLSLDVLEEANIQKADAFIAVTDDDKTNLLSCTRAKDYGCPLTVALVNDPSLSSLLSPMGIDAHISPRSNTVSSILQHIRHGLIRSVYSIGDGEAEVIEAQVVSTSNIAGKKLKEIDWPDGSLVGIIKGEKGLKIPRGETKFEEGDIITLFSLSSDIQKVESLLQVGVDFF